MISPEERPGFWKKYRWWLITSLVFISLLVFLMQGERVYELSKDRVLLARVEATLFEDVISFQARVEPEVSFSLDAVEGGTVQEIFVEAGQAVKAGQPLLRLANTTLMLDFMNRETQIVEQINNLRNTRMQLELNERQLQEQVLDLRFEQEAMARQYAIDTLLFKDSVIASQEFLDSEARFRYLVEKRELLEDNFQTNRHYRARQLEALDRSIEMMERNLNAIRKNLENLVVKAPIDGQLTTFIPEIGQSINRGENIGRIEDLDTYILRANIDEHYLSRVEVGQKAFYELNNYRWELTVSKVYPQVSNNQFVVDFEYQDTIPAQLRSGQGLNLRLALSASANAVLVPRGAFFSSTGGNWVFVLNDKGDQAYKRAVELGRQNPDYIEVISGLEPGEQIISSSYESFKEYEQLRLKSAEHE
ncbi:efflux RND transporter periplasmic adaptor subunit [Croceimicrobium sp.]|uniref:efflux RND transporter periplasmic adaptor subunit n=1 Tax=Croceimicrobium sp. TaxID=2828340 RepID=UPI003BA94440